MNNTKLLITPKNNKHECCDNQIYYDCMLQPNITPDYIIPCTEKYLRIDNFLSEYNDLQSQIRVKKNLGINEIVYWGNIQGDLTNQKDLCDYIKLISTPEIKLDKYLQDLKDLNNKINNKVSIEINDQTESSKQIKYQIQNDDIILNDDFNKAVTNVLSGKSPESIDDVIRVMMYKIFPIEYKKWSINSTGNISKTYSFEKGTTLNINSNDLIGTITLTAIPGNLKDSATLTFDDKIVSNKLTQFTCNKQITAGDVLGSNLTYTTNTTKTKTYEYKLTTSSNNNPNPGTNDAKIEIKTFQYYYFLSGVEIPTTNSFSGADIAIYKTFSSTGNYDLGNKKLYLYVLSPKQINQVRTAAGVSENAANQFMVITGWKQKQVKYTPIEGGDDQTYYLMWLEGTQSNYVKIEIS